MIEGQFQIVSNYLIIEKNMGCQNSTSIQITDQSNRIQPIKLQDKNTQLPKKNVNSKSKIAEEGKENMDHRVPSEKVNFQQIRVITHDEKKVQTSVNDAKMVEMVWETIDKIQRCQEEARIKRRTKYLNPQSRQQWESYLDQIVSEIKQRKKNFEKFCKQFKDKYLAEFDKEFNIQDINSLLTQCLTHKHSPHFQVQRWLKEKVISIRLQGQNWLKWLKQICSSWEKSKQLIPEILNVIIEDHIRSANSFLAALSLEYEYKNILAQELQEWEEEIRPIFSQISHLIS